MAEVKRYAPESYVRHFEWGTTAAVRMKEMPATSSEPGWYAHSDYTVLERKCQELEREVERMHEWNAQLDRAIAKLALEREDVDMQVERLRKIEAAAIKLVKCKGRYHTEQNYNALAAALGDGRKG